MVIVSIGGLSALRYYAPTKPNVTYSEDLNRKDMELVISDYIKNNYFDWEDLKSYKKYEVHKIYGTDKKFGITYVYIHTLYSAYDNNKKEIAGGADHLVIMLKKDSNGIYSVINHKAPMQGEAFPLSLKILVPHKYRMNMISNKLKTLEELNEKIDFEVQNS